MIFMLTLLQNTFSELRENSDQNVIRRAWLFRMELASPYRSDWTDMIS